MHLLFAGMESYHVRHWGPNVTTERGPAETAGLLWGYVVSREDRDHVVVEHVSTDTFAKGTSGEVGLNEEVTRVKQEVVAKRWPHLSMIGDFHTHPYKTYSDAKDNAGWEFSEGDRDWYEKHHDAASWPGCVALVLAIGKLAKFHENNILEPTVVADNTVHWQFDRFRFWLSGYAIDARKGKRRSQLVVSPRTDDETGRRAVYLDVPTVNGTNAWFSYP